MFESTEIDLSLGWMGTGNSTGFGGFPGTANTNQKEGIDRICDWE